MSQGLSGENVGNCAAVYYCIRGHKSDVHKVRELHVEPLDTASALYGNPAGFASGTTMEAIHDTAENLGLALRIGTDVYPLRMTAYKTLLDRAKINGTALTS